MAKSLRSKFKRMCRNTKRQRYAVKEMKRLCDMLGVEYKNDTQTETPTAFTFVAPGSLGKEKEVKEESKVREEEVRHFGYTSKGQVIDSSDDEIEEMAIDETKNSSDTSLAKVIRVPSDEEGELNGDSKNEQSSSTNITEMDHSQKRYYNPKTMRDQFGNFPVWFNKKQRSIYKTKVKTMKKTKKQHEKRVMELARRPTKSKAKKKRRSKKENSTEQQ